MVRKAGDGGDAMIANEWHDTKPPKDKHALVWVGAEERRAYWTGKLWRDVLTGKVLRDVTHWREVDA